MKVLDNRLVYIYVLIDPRNNEVRYVGKSVNPLQRYKEHCNSYRFQKKGHKNNWIKSLFNVGLKPRLEIVEISDRVSWIDRECWWISLYDNLTNETTGGEGVHGRIHTAEEREKRRIAMTGKKMPPIHGEKTRLAKLGKPLTEKHRQAVSEGKRNSHYKIPKEQSLAWQDKGVQSRIANSTSPFVGVYKRKVNNKWVATIRTVDKKSKYIGEFLTEEAAAQAYNEWSLLEGYVAKYINDVQNRCIVYNKVDEVV